METRTVHNMQTDTHTSLTYMNDVSVVTVTRGREIFTLVSNTDGQDILVNADGSHSECDGFNVPDIPDWVMDAINDAI